MRKDPFPVMEGQTDIFEAIDANKTGTLRNSDPETSHRAGRDIRGRSGTIRRKVYEALATKWMTDFELWQLIGGAESSARKRRQELMEAGLVVDSGERRLTGNGSLAIVWRLA